MDAKEFVSGAEILLETENAENAESCSNSDENTDEEWVNVSHSEDEIDFNVEDEDNNDEDVIEEDEDDDDDVDDEESASDLEDVNETDQSTCTQNSSTNPKTKKKIVTKKEQLAEKREKAAQVSSMRILTDEDFKRIEIAQLNKQMTSAKNRKRPAEPDETSR